MRTTELRPIRDWLRRERERALTLAEESRRNKDGHHDYWQGQAGAFDDALYGLVGLE